MIPYEVVWVAGTDRVVAEWCMVCTTFPSTRQRTSLVTAAPPTGTPSSRPPPPRRGRHPAAVRVVAALAALLAFLLVPPLFRALFAVQDSRETAMAAWVAVVGLLGVSAFLVVFARFGGLPRPWRR